MLNVSLFNLVTAALTSTDFFSGTCRDCPIRSGGFQLYDDALRRRLEEETGFQLRVRKLEVRSRVLETESTEDCQCVEGTSPVKPQAPGVTECVDQMNLEMESIRREQGLLENITITDLVQLNQNNGFDLLDVDAGEEAEAEEPVQFDSDVEVGRSPPSFTSKPNLNIWSRSGASPNGKKDESHGKDTDSFAVDMAGTEEVIGFERSSAITRGSWTTLSSIGVMTTLTVALMRR